MLSRRGFVISGVAVGGGLVLGYAGWRLDDGDAASKFAAKGQPGAPMNAWLKITNDGDIICAIHRAEMGQGVTTSLAMLLAEELDADWSRVSFEFPDIDRDYYNFGILKNGQPLGDPEASMLAGTGTWAIRQVFHSLGLAMTISSSSMVDAWDSLRPAGAAARHMLIAAAARKWQCAPEGLVTEKNWVVDEIGGRKFSYGELAESAARERPPRKPELKLPANYSIVGHNVPRLDALAKVTGVAEFGIDVTLPDMLYAAIVHSSIAGTRVATFDASEALAMPGVHNVLLAGEAGKERAVAVIADNTWQAFRAAATISVEPADEPEQVVNSADFASEYGRLLDSAIESNDSDSGPVVFRDDGMAASIIASASHLITAEYAVPFLAHVCMEPMNCTAMYTGNKLEIWSPSQANSVAKDIAVAMSGLDASQVLVHTTFMGGGFGRRAELDYVKQAVSVALKLPGRPVKLLWSREQDIRHDAFRPAAYGRLRAVLDTAGKPSALDFQLVTQSVVASYETRTPTPRGATPRSDASVVTAADPLIYPLKNLRVSFVPVISHVPAGYWRSVSHSWCTFFIESFIDELAVAAGTDSLAFRQSLLRERPRQLAVLNTAAAQLDWNEELDDGIGRGIAVSESHDSVVAHVIEVITENGQFKRVSRVVCAIDCGFIIHPDNVIAQLESSIVDGVSAALYGQIDIKSGVVVQGNFDTYRRLTMRDTPPIEVHLINSDRRPGGVGEPGVPGVAPALTNAIFNATGRRIRTLPIARIA